MMSKWTKVAMIMLVGLLAVAGPTIAPHQVAAQNAPGVDKMLNQAQADHDKAMQMYNSMMTKMDSMKGMSMTANEKAMMSMMKQMSDTMKMLMESNQRLLDAVKQMHMSPGQGK